MLRKMSNVHDNEILFAIAAFGAAGVRIGGAPIVGEDFTALGRTLGVFSFKAEPDTDSEWANDEALGGRLIDLARSGLLIEVGNGDGYRLSETGRAALVGCLREDIGRVQWARAKKEMRQG